jgi:hypothetical protein
LVNLGMAEDTHKTGLPAGFNLEESLKKANDKYGMSRAGFNQVMATYEAKAERDWAREVERINKRKEREGQELGPSTERDGKKPRREIKVEHRLAQDSYLGRATPAVPNENPSHDHHTSPPNRPAAEGNSSLLVSQDAMDLDMDNGAGPTKEYKLPDWWLRVDPKGRKMKDIKNSKDPKVNQTIKALEALKDCLRRCEEESNPRQLVRYLDELRDHIHKAEFLPVNEHILVKVHMLDNGLTRIIAPKGKDVFPWDIKADALQLYERWLVKNFEPDLLRGIVESKKKDKDKEGKRNADRIDETWRKKYSPNPSPKYHGDGGLVVGYWWPTQLCTVRDGAHGAAQGGIYGEKQKGAYSIVLSGGNHYGDRDEGNEIWYSGTDGKDFTPTENTTRLIESCDLISPREPVRVIRSWNLQKANPYRPQRGFRYDGLYDVVDYTLVDQAKAIYIFHLVRRQGQNPIRYEDNAMRRPTRWEIEEYDKLREQGRGVSADAW